MFCGVTVPTDWRACAGLGLVILPVTHATFPDFLQPSYLFGGFRRAVGIAAGGSLPELSTAFLLASSIGGEAGCISGGNGGRRQEVIVVKWMDILILKRFLSTEAGKGV